MDAIIFDFDGVIVDSEPIHFACFADVLARRGLRLTREDYYAKYLGFDDHDCFQAVCANNGINLTEGEIAAMTTEKTLLVTRALRESTQPQPGAVELISSAAKAGVLLAICSGALRNEIDLAIQAIGVSQYFSAIISAKDVARGKPDPQGYKMALQCLVDVAGRQLAPGRCLAIEDAPAGIQAARGAGMKVLAVTASYPPQALAAAQKVVASLADVNMDMLSMICM
jgi:beta-phosphoglucomutase